MLCNLKQFNRCNVLSLAFVSVLASNWLANLFGADPSPKGPFEPLRAHATAPEAEGLWKQVVAAEQEVRKDIEKFLKSKAIDPKQLSDALLTHDNMRTWDMRLQALGEPFAVDFELRRSFYQSRLVDAYNAWLSQPNSPPVRQKAIAQLTKTQPQRIQKYTAIAALLDRQELEQAESKIDEAKVELFRLTNILSLEERRPFTEPFENIRSRVESAANASRSILAADIFKQKVAANESETQDTLRKLDLAIEALSNAGVSSWNGEQVDGPTLLAHACDALKQAHVKLQSSATLERIQNRAAAAGSYAIAYQSQTEDRWPAAASELTGAFLNRIEKLIRAESLSVPDERAKEHYFAMLTTLSDLDVRLNQESWTMVTQKALADLTRKAGMSLEVADYEAATSELLFWRERFVAARAKNLVTHSHLPSLCKEKLSTSPQQRIGLYSHLPEDPGRPRLLSAIPDLVPLVASTMSNAKVIAKDVRRLDSSKSTWMSQFQAGVYCMMDSEMVLAEPIAKLEKLLLVDPSNPPLSLRATSALNSAHSGAYLAVGCTLQDFVIESAVSRFATFPVPAGPLVPLGSVHPQGIQGEQSFLLIRFVAKPEWYHHRYFLVSKD